MLMERYAPLWEALLERVEVSRMLLIRPLLHLEHFNILL